MLEIIGFVLAIAIGISLGMIGGGGSTLAVPVLVYLIGISPTMATGYSLFIIGATSLVGGVRYSMKGLVDFKIALAFGVPSIFSVYATRKFVIPAIPETIFELGSFVLTKDSLVMALFALLMIAASYSNDQTKQVQTGSNERAKILGNCAFGRLGRGPINRTGRSGWGIFNHTRFGSSCWTTHAYSGGHLAVHNCRKVPSLAFTGDISNYSIDWSFLGLFTALAIVGIFIGSRLATIVNAGSLKKSFGWFVLVMGIFILGIEFLT